MFILYFFILVAICAFLGWGIHGLLYNTANTPPGIMLALGYSFGISFFFLAYIALSSSTRATLCVLLFAAGINAINAYINWRGSKSILVGGSIKRDWPPYALFIFVVLFSALTYFSGGLGGYWHTANEDIFDGLNGRTAYINGEVLHDTAKIETASRVRGGLDETLLEQSGITPLKDSAFFKNRYIHDLGRLQYSSLAFISELLGLPKGMDVFLLQALLNIGLFALGVHACVRYVFAQSKLVAIVTASMATIGNFYLTSYFNGHEGSLMYNAVIPYVFYYFVLWIRDAQSINRSLFGPVILLLMVVGAYPYPLPYLVVPVVLYYILNKFFPRIGSDLVTLDGWHKQRNILLAFGFLSVLAFIAAYFLAAPLRLRALDQFRSWGTMHNHIGFLQFWGVWPSNLAYTSTPIAWLNAHLSLKLLSLFLAGALSFTMIYGSIQIVKRKNVFLLSWLPISILFFFVMRFAVYDSYYVYKYLYINAWIVYTLTTAGLISLASHKHFAAKTLAIILAVSWIGANLANNASAMWEISSKPFNKDATQYADILNAPKDMLEQSYIGIPQDDHADLLRLILAENGIVTVHDKAKAKFILTEQGLSDILQESLGAPAWHSGLFSLTAMPGNDITELASYWGVEGTNIPFRWVSDGRNGTLLLGLYKRTNQSNYLFMCAESGPSVGYRPVSVNIFDARNQLAGTMIFSSYACHTINVSRFQPPFSLKHNEDGVIASYIDQRKLIYRVMHIGFSPTAEVDQSYLTLNNGKDIVDSRYTATNAKPKIMLGAGWYSYETYQNESFRWANNNPEIIVSNSSVPGWLAINVAPGPSAGKDILNLELLDSKNKNVGSCIVNSRKICTFPISHMESGKSKYRLHSDATGVPIPTDPRKLNFRVFGIEWQ